MTMSFTLGWPQGIVLFLSTLSLFISIACHGKPRDDHNGIVKFIDTLILIGLLYWGGFFG